MSVTHDEALCIRNWDWSETSQTVALFTKENGIVRGLAKGARREKGKFSSGFDILSRGEVGFVLKRESDLATLTEWDVREHFPILRDNSQANKSGWYVVDMIGRMLPAADPHPVLYMATLQHLRALQSGASHGHSLLRFQWTLLEETGWRPEIKDPDPRASTIAFDPTEGRFTVDSGIPTHWRIRRGTLRALESMTGDGEQSLDEECLNRANRLLASHLRNVLGEEPSTMSAVFGALPTGFQKTTRATRPARH